MLPATNTEGILEGPCLERLEAMRRRLHSGCFACRALPFRLDFAVEAEGVLAATVTLDTSFCSYEGTVHGGLLSLLFDETAVCCLFARGVDTVTADLQTRFRLPVRPGEPVRVRGEVTRSRRYLHSVRMWMEQGERLVANAKAEMWKRGVRSF